MGSITTGIGLISGIDTASLIDNLIALESRSKITLQQRIARLQSQQTALLDINARLLSFKNLANAFRSDSIFQSALATSSDDSVLTASATAKAQPGTFNFIVKQLVSNSQKLSRGFADAGTSPVGLSSLDFAFGKGNLDRDRELADLNAGQGVRAGKISITDRTGNQATIDLTDATHLKEVLARINDAADISVTASVEGNSLVLTDTSGGSGSLTVANVAGGFAATDLGILGTGSGNTLTGTAINTIGSATGLGTLNDGTGVLIRNNNPDIRITTRDGAIHNIDFGRIDAPIDTGTLLATLNNGDGITLSDDDDNPDIKVVARDGTEYEINLSGITTVNGLINRINNQTSGHIQLSVTDGQRFTLTDTIGGEGPLKVLGAGENENATAADLGLLNEDGVEADSILGDVVPSTIQNPPASTLGQIIQRINDQSGGAVTASINAATGALQLTDNTGGGGNFIVAGTAANQFAAQHLGIKTESGGVSANTINGERLVADLGSVLVRHLNGGSGLGEGSELTITDRSGASMTIGDLDSYDSLSQIIAAINAKALDEGVAITVSMNNAGTGLKITDASGGSSSNLIIAGSAAGALGIEADTEETSVRGSNLSPTYVTEASKLSDLNYGRGIGTGSFRITDSFGKSATINVGPNQATLYDVIQTINAQGGAGGLAIRARVNDTGDGLLIEEDLTDVGSASPFVAMKVESINGSTARDLNILGTASSVSGGYIDGGYTRTLTFNETDTLNDIVAKINESGIPISASVLNTGSGANPFRINFTSEVSGRLGEMILDSGDFDLGLSTLAKGQDAKVFFGGGDGAGDGFLVTSRTNTVNNILPNVSIDLKKASDSTVSITVARDDAKILDAVNKFVNSFNDVISRIDEYDFFDVESEKRGILLGNPTASRIRSVLQRTVQQRAEGVDTQYQFLRDVGIRIGSGGKLTFDEAKFQQAWENDPTAVENLFAAYESTTQISDEIAPGVTVQTSTVTTTTRGFGDIFNDLLANLTDSDNGTITLAENSFKSQIELNQDRMAAIDQRLERRRVQLERQFAAMESALAQLQGQGNAIGSLANNVQLAGSMFNR